MTPVIHLLTLHSNNVYVFPPLGIKSSSIEDKISMKGVDTTQSEKNIMV